MNLDEMYGESSTEAAMGNVKFERGADKAKFEPPHGSAYTGAGQCMESIAAMIHSLPNDRMPVIIALYEGLNAEEYWRNPDILEAHNVFPGAMLQIGLQLPIHNDNDLAAIGEGGYDRQIEEMADLYRSIQLPVFLRIGYEFDGEWNGYNPKLYKRAYRRIVDAFRAGGTDNVAFVWNTYIADNRNMFDWYPDNPDTGERDGDDYVDWFSFNTITPSFDASWFMEQAAARGKPVMIGESSYAIVKPDYAFETFMGDFMGMLTKRGIKGFQHINWEWRVYPENAQWLSWANGRYTDDADLVIQYNRHMEDERLIFRDGSYRDPVALFVDCARALKEADGGGQPWERSFDHCTLRNGCDYRFMRTVVRYGNGWFPYCESVDEELEAELRVPAGVPGYIILNLNIGNGASLDPAAEYVVYTEGCEYRFFSRKGGYHKIPIQSQTETAGRRIVLRIANKRKGETVKLAQIGFLALAETSLPTPNNVRVENYGSATIVQWDQTDGAAMYNVYKDHQLIGMTDKTYYVDDDSDSEASVYGVSAYCSHRGEGLLSFRASGPGAAKG